MREKSMPADGPLIQNHSGIPVSIRRRAVDKQILDVAASEGIATDLSGLIAGRRVDPGQVKHLVNPKLSYLTDPSLLPDIDRAAERILVALSERSIISISCDHDADGTGAGMVLYRALVTMGHPPDRIVFHISHRLKEGYGLNSALAERILCHDPRPSLVITADSGSSDEPRICRLKQAGIDVIVTDHHTLPVSGPPASALACVSPIRSDSKFGDKTICGAVVAWLLMAHVRRSGIDLGHLPASLPKFGELFSGAAIATVADCVSIASINNRAIINAGLRLLNHSDQPFAQALRHLLCTDGRKITEETLGFQIAPRLAAHGRLDESMPSIRFMTASTRGEAADLLDVLSDANEQRKIIQREMTEVAIDLAAAAVSQGMRGLAVHLVDGMAGVHGITSSRITEIFGLPSAMISPVVSDPKLVSLSGRSIEAVNLKQVLQDVSDAAPGLFVSFGGHAMACGARFAADDVPHFKKLFNQMVLRQVPDLQPIRQLWTDGELSQEVLTPEYYDEMRSLAPFGRGFEPPAWHYRFIPTGVRTVGKDPVHVQFRITVGNVEVKCVWFFAIRRAGDRLPLKDGIPAMGVFNLAENLFRGKRNIELQCQHALSSAP